MTATNDDEDSVRTDADPACSICEGVGWHWGWKLIRSGEQGRRIHAGDPVMLRCPCVDSRRASASQQKKA